MSAEDTEYGAASTDELASEPTSSVRNRYGYDLHYRVTDPRGRALAGAGGIVNPQANALWEKCLAITDWDTVVDVGANYGEMLATPKLAGARRIVALEPSPAIAACLRRTIGGLPWDVDLVESAVGSRSDATVTLLVDLDWSGKSRVTEDLTPPSGTADRVEPTRVSMTTIDALLADDDTESLACKIDVEGAEADVLLGAAATLDRVARVALMVEVLHMSVQDLERLGRRFPLFFLHEETGNLVRWHGTDPLALGRFIHSGEIHRENALLLAGSDVRAFTREVQYAAANSARRAVYTALFGNYEELREQPIATATDVDFICFTDDPSLASETWEIRLVSPEWPEDLVRSSRLLKVLGDESLREYDETLWIDNRVELTADPNEILNDLLADADIALHAHDFRETVADEFQAVAEGGYDDPARVYEQLIAYAEHRPEVLDEKPLWTGIVARRADPAVQSAMRVWMDQILRYSRRDQLSVLFALDVPSLRINVISGDNRESDWHRWPPINRRVRARRGAARAFSRSLRPPIAGWRETETAQRERIGALEQSLEARTKQLDDARRAHADAKRALDAAAEDRTKLLDVRASEKYALRAQARRAHNELRLARRDLENLRQSKSVRIATTLGRLVRGGRRR